MIKRVNGDESINEMYSFCLNKKRLTPDEERSLFIAYSNGDLEAKKELIECSLYRVISIARLYSSFGISLEDLVQEGCIGLIRAVDKYNLDLGVSFVCFSFFIIKGAIKRAIANKNRNVRIPVHIYEKLNKYLMIIRYLTLVLKREPSYEDLVRIFNSSHKDEVLKMVKNLNISYDEFMTLASEFNFSYQEFLKLQNIFYDTASLDILPCDVSSDYVMEDAVVDKILFDEAMKAIDVANLTEKELLVLSHYYCLFDEEYMSLSDMARLLSVKRQGVSVINKSALKKVKRVSERGNN